MAADARLGPYRVLREIRQGGQGRVLLGHDGRLDRRVAIKILDLPGERSERRNLLGEARLLARIESPRVVQVHDVITAGDHLALVMEYVPGTDLEQLLQKTQPSVATVISVATDLAGALAAARQQGIVHGDLKAANVLVSTAGRAKLTDFGVARGPGQADHAAGDAGASFGGGSPSAVSPEQLRGEPLDVRSDLFALGCLMYRMLSGQHPFLRGGQLDAQGLLSRPHEPLATVLPPALEVPEQLLALVDSLLAKHPGDRPANTHQVRQILRESGREIPLSAGNPLRSEASPYFEDERVEQLPPAIPGGLVRRGRSRLRPPSQQRPWSWRNPAARPRLIGLGCLLAAVCVGSVVAAVTAWQQPLRIHIEDPQLQIDGGAALTGGLSVAWLVDELKRELGGRLGPIHVTGPVGASPRTTLYTRGRSPAEVPASERFHLDLRCSEDFCFLGLRRERTGWQYASSEVLLPESSPAEWRVALGKATAQLFESPGVPAREAQFRRSD